ncbi:hypothetical protein Anas_11137 [Armadillidium nasatum]|uniref:Uncharacterized protein n=1 Tax=Armadillidium nasatum TaxID=96803 RepID=A0A5N5TAW2_9CRUS|nr:hypothetical protein Anas_11137 [Armadillidium nasatum]
MTMRGISLNVLLPMVIFLSASAQNLEEKCLVDPETINVDKFMNEAPPDWTFGCMNKRLITEAINNKEYIKGIMECLHPEHPFCAKKGYNVIAEEILKRTDAAAGGRCTSCSPETTALIDYALKLMQKLHPRELRLGLSYLG